MKRWLLRLYPKWWRERYGAELGALLEDAPPRAADSWDLAKGAIQMQFNQGSRSFAIALLGAALFGAACYLWHVATSPYVAEATVTVPSTVDNREVNTQAQQILSRRALKDVIDRHSLFRGHMPMEDEIEFLRKNFRISAIDASRRLQLAYRNEDPAKAQAVAAELTRAFAARLSGSQVSRLQATATPAPVSLPMLIGGTGLGLLVGLAVSRKFRKA